MSPLNTNKKTSFFITLFAFIAVGGFLFLLSAEAARAYSWSDFVNDWKGGAGMIVDGAASVAGNLFSDAIKTVLGWVLQFLGWLLSVAALIFAWAADAKTLTDVINGPSIYAAWKVIRDLLNMAFILVLVYTAFTIIFQVDSTNKKRILTVVLMALLVNFSFPIARFIIDVGNSLMYTIFKNLLPTTDTIFSNFAKNSDLGNIINGNNTGASAAQLIGAIIFVAIMTVTFLMMAVLFVIRIVALAIIIIFSPIAFVGVAIPSMGSKADQWWDYLFKYTFFGPAMALMLYIATQVMNATTISVGGNTAFSKFSQDPSGGSVIASMAAFAVPIIILWIGMGLAQKMGIEGADMVTKQGKGALAWAGKKFSGYNMAKRQYDAYAGARKKREDEKNKNRIGGKIGDKFNRWQDTAVGKVPLLGRSAKKRAEKMRVDDNKKSLEDGSKDLIDKGADAYTLGDTLNSDFGKKTTKKDKLDQAKQATAFKKQDYNEKKGFVKSVVQNATIANRSRLDNVINISADDIGLDSRSTEPAMMAKVAAYNTERGMIQTSVAAAKGGAVLSADQLDEITAFVNKQMGRKIKIGTDAK